MNTINLDRERLSQNQMLADMQHEQKPTDMITVYQVNKNNLYHELYICCALIPIDQAEEALSDSEWDLALGDNVPDPASNVDGIEPLLIFSNNDVVDNTINICEEFRLFHSLGHDEERR